MYKSGAIVIEGHVQGLSNTRALGEAGIPVIVVDNKNCITRYSKYCNKFYKCPAFNKDEFALFLVQLAQKDNLKNWVLFPSNDHAVVTISKHKNILEKYYHIITPDFTIIQSIYDKTKLLKLGSDCNVPIPNTIYKINKDSRYDSLSYPVIIKGKFGLNFYKTTGKKAFFAENSKQLTNQLSIIQEKYDISEAFIQELIPPVNNNKTISFTAFCSKGEIKTYWMGVKLREHPKQFGTATFCKSIYIPELLEISKPLLKRLNYTGVCEIEYIKDPRDNQYKLIEINARTWLWVGLAKACGINYALIIYKYLHREKISYPTSYQTNIYWINILVDLAYAIIYFITGNQNIFSILKSYKNNHSKAIYDSKDNKPFWAFICLIFSILKNR